MKIRFIGSPENPGLSTLRWFDRDFVLGESVDVSDLEDRERQMLSRHPHFELVKRGRPKKIKQPEQLDDDLLRCGEPNTSR